MRLAKEDKPCGSYYPMQRHAASLESFYHQSCSSSFSAREASESYSLDSFGDTLPCNCDLSNPYEARATALLQ
ncbi:hypothetical protein [Porphyromonas endodontalis]|uniref:hypothetical protein n=1 Tax=Porphyromonas endodontalis TaxID=28124 RepID=UPI0028E9F7B0|nr:hypothetical protein [Porphyromonas endodontalis]